MNLNERSIILPEIVTHFGSLGKSRADLALDALLGSPNIGPVGSLDSSGISVRSSSVFILMSV